MEQDKIIEEIISDEISESTPTTESSIDMPPESTEIESDKKKKEKKLKKKGNGLTITLLIAVLICILLCMTNLYFTFKLTKESSTPETKSEQRERKSKNNAEKDSEDEDEGTEDRDENIRDSHLPENGTVIADEYQILSTTHISDAYINNDTSELEERDTEVLKMASDVIEECITEDMTDYEKEKAIYDWMITNLDFDDGALSVIPKSLTNSDNPYGVLKYHNAVCVGYATTFRLFMEMLEIPCRVVYDSELFHSWNLVQIDDGWYHTDVYSAVDTDSYAYFNMTDGMLIYDYSWDYEEYPAAESLEYNPAYLNASACEDVYLIPSIIREGIDNADTLISFKLPYDDEDKNFYLAEDILYKLENAYYTTDDVYFSYTFECLDDEYLYIVTYEVYDYEGEYEDYEDLLTEEEQSLIIDALNESFGDLFDEEMYTDDYWYDEEEYWDEEEWFYDEEY